MSGKVKVISAKDSMSTRTKMKVLSLYRVLLRESQKFSNYNFRTYFQMRIRDAFKENKSLQDEQKIQEFIKSAEENVEVIRRQVIIGQMYKDVPMILEAPEGHKT